MNLKKRNQTKLKCTIIYLCTFSFSILNCNQWWVTQTVDKEWLLSYLGQRCCQEVTMYYHAQLRLHGGSNPGLPANWAISSALEASSYSTLSPQFSTSVFRYQSQLFSIVVHYWPLRNAFWPLFPYSYPDKDKYYVFGCMFYVTVLST